MIYNLRSSSASEISKRRIMLVVNTRRKLEVCKSRNVGYVSEMKKTVNVCRIFVENLFESDYLENSNRDLI
jgi:hypothetical protein